MLLLGVLAAQAAGVAPAPVAAGDFELIETQTLTTTTASVTFDVTGLGDTYDHLQLRIIARTNRSGFIGDIIKLTFNNDSGSNYNFHYMRGSGSSVAAARNTSNTYIETYRLPANNAASNIYGAMVIDVLNAFSTSQNTTIRNLAGATGVDGIYFQSGSWMNTAALTEIDLTPLGSFVANSRLSLYGWKAAA